MSGIVAEGPMSNGAGPQFGPLNFFSQWGEHQILAASIRNAMESGFNLVLALSTGRVHPTPTAALQQEANQEFQVATQKPVDFDGNNAQQQWLEQMMRQFNGNRP